MTRSFQGFQNNPAAGSAPRGNYDAYRRVFFFQTFKEAEIEAKTYYRIFRVITRTAYYAQLPILAAKYIFDHALNAPEDNAHCSPLTSYTTVPDVSPMYRIKCRRSGIREEYV